ncbi:UDP-2,3-diacylglucosamine diphosphatase [Salinisphaera sp. LB1]|uniref:UDP-2,3-diacylglucosamine diphosphatase n=1 Tax=Salinisphaera sp. LB1 TaxID=2183911 RepID=UPI000D705BCC|nr:UDP-2,3-diacylglucosamine diphosphatase [Salinisphaera sp. LB1]AWN15623.1 Ser/Thr protein phosphatase family protein, UDP-2,3-diacylglucosamine hydrolase-like protein [Salinisphaera sp. LB1]
MSFDDVLDPRPVRHDDRSTRIYAPSGGPSPATPRGFHCYRSVWISDFHLGTRGCRAERLLDFLATVRCDTLYLVGDIIDAWALKKAWYWPASHSAVIQAVLSLHRDHGTRIVYVPGNHDEMLRDYLPLDLAGIEICNECVHKTADGRQYLVIHGDAFDAVCTEARWLAVLGDYAYRGVIVGNSWFNAMRRRLGYPYWSLSAFLKYQVKNAVAFIGRFEEALADEARRRDLDGIICGHIHTPSRRTVNGVDYCNDGDWVESCTALTEDFAGRMELLYWGRGTDDEMPAERESRRRAASA